MLTAKKAIPLIILLVFTMIMNFIHITYHPHLTRIKFPTTKLPVEVVLL